LEERGGGHAADGEFLRTIEKFAAADRAVHVSIEQIQQLSREIGCLLAFHENVSVIGSEPLPSDTIFPATDHIIGARFVTRAIRCIGHGAPGSKPAF
jgi:hypothetical protein